MATITQTSALDASDVVTLARTTLTASDTFTYVPGAKQYLLLANNTGGSITATVNGSANTPINVQGYGSVATAGGKAIAVPANTTMLVALDDISAFLKGTISVTGGTGLIASLII
jgi:hypothetical protein